MHRPDPIHPRPASATSIVRVVAGVAVLSAGIALSGCTAGGAADDGVTTVTVMHQVNEFSEEYVAQFEEENPDIKIEFIEYDESRLNAMLTAGDPPDLVRGSPSANLFARGLAAPLDDFIAESDLIHEDDLLPVNDLWRWDGEQQGVGARYGIIKDFSPDNTLWQNEAIYEAAGVEPFSTTEPVTWDDALAKAIELKNAGVENALGLEWQWGVEGVLNSMVTSQGSSLFSDDLKTAQFDTPEVERAIQWFIDFGLAGVGPTSLNPLADGQDAPSFLAGRMATTKDGFWFGGNLAGDDGATVAETASLVPAPYFDERVSPVLGGVGAWIPAASDAKEEAWRVLEWFTMGQPGIDRASSGWGLPGVESLWSHIPTEKPYQQQALDLVKEEVEFVVPLSDSPYVSGLQWSALLNTEIAAGIAGEKTAKEIAATLQSEVQGLLDQGVDQLG
jgi:multiple sugar transport system substrate-binding protein